MNVTKKEQNCMMILLDRYLESRSYHSARTTTDISLTRFGANKGNNVSLESMGINYYGGHVVNKNNELALYYMERAGLLGNVRAMVFCGIANSLGIGTESNLEVAHWWFSRASERGNANAKFILNLNTFKGFKPEISLEYGNAQGVTA